VSVNITQQFILYTIKIAYCQGREMFRPLLGHLQALWEKRSKSYLYFNTLWDPKCLQIVLYECEIHKFVYIYQYIQTYVKYVRLYILVYIQTHVFHIHITQCEIRKFVYIVIYTNICISHSYNTICKHFGSHNALKYR